VLEDVPALVAAEAVADADAEDAGARARDVGLHELEAVGRI
jgi:hypothetical protein